MIFQVRLSPSLAVLIDLKCLEYKLTWTLDSLRRNDFGRLDRSGETYVDYMGGALYPESLITAHTEFLHRSILGNTHSVSNRWVSHPWYINRSLIFTQLQVIRQICQ